MIREIAIKVRNWGHTEARILSAFGALAFCLLTILSAQVRIPLPFTPIPMTLQTLVAPLAGAFLGIAWGALSMALYLVLGFAGLHVFAAAPGGWSFFLAPSSGYVFGFLVAAVVLGWARDHRVGKLPLLGALVLSHVMIFVCGYAGLVINTGMNAGQALAAGVVPFVIGDILKITASYLLLLTARVPGR